MDERRYPGGEDDIDIRSSTGFSSYYSDRSSKTGSFKVNIDGLDNEPPAYIPTPAAKKAPQATSGTSKMPVSSVPSSRPAQPRRPAQPARPAQTQRPAQPARPAQTQRPAQPARPAQTQRTAQPARPAQTQRPAQPVRPTQTQRPAQPARPAAQTQRPAAESRTTAKNAAASKPPRKPKPEAEKSAAKEKKAAKTEKAKSSTRREKTAVQKENRKYRMIRGLFITLTCLICIGIVTATVSTMALSTINDILAIKKQDSSVTVSVVIPEGSDFDDVYSILCDNDLIKQEMLCKLFCKFRHYDKAYSTKQKKFVNIEYTPGVYFFETNSGVENMLEAIKVSSTNSKDTVRLTFPEGWTIAKIFERIEKYNVCTAEQLYANLDIVGKQFDFYNNIKANSGRYLKAEGYLFPDTYDFYIGESASSVIKKLFANYEAKWTADYKKRAQKLGMTQDEILTLASIIQREAKDSTQMADISSVLHNRLKDPATYPNLQMNSTKEYITAVNEYGLFNDVYYSIYLDSYNTYSATGLPPGPICNPGAAAIKAALYPSNTNYHFFCHDSKGNIYLAVTAAEHQKNAALVLYQ